MVLQTDHVANVYCTNVGIIYDGKKLFFSFFFHYLGHIYVVDFDKLHPIHCTY